MQSPLTRREMLRLTGNAIAATALMPSVSYSAGKAISSNKFGAVASDPPVMEVGEQVLKDGGNAIDAAVAAAFAAGVIIPGKTGIGGYGGSATIALTDGRVTCIDFNSTAPAAATPDMFPLDDKGSVIGKKNFHGWLAAGVPGTCAGLQMAIDRYGSKSLRELLQPAIKLAKATTKKDRFVDFAALAKTLSTLADRNSIDSLYRGDIANEIANAFQKNGGLVTTKDLAAYQAHETAPYRLRWDDYEICTAPLGACGLLVLEALSILKALKWDSRKQPPQEATHARLEALRLSWKDRADFFGDPGFVQVAIKELLSKDYAKEQAALVQSAVKGKKALSLKIERVEQIGTLHISSVDSKGNFASITLTHGSSYGAQVSVDSIGMVLGQGMARFDPRPGHPNSIAPGKRPVHNMAPCVLLRNQKPVLAVGAAGGTKIPNSLYDFFSHYLGRRRSMEDALDQPRMNCVGIPNVTLEKTWPKEEADYLRKIGFKVTTGLGAFVSGVTFDPKSKIARGKTRVGNPFQETPGETVQ